MEFSHPLFLSRLEFLKAAFWALFFFWFSSMISPTVWKNPLYLFADDSTLCHTICHPSDRQAAASSLNADLVISQTGPTRGTCLSIRTNLSLSLCLSERTVEKVDEGGFLNTPLEEVLSFKLLGLTICYDLSWESHISNLAPKASH